MVKYIAKKVDKCNREVEIYCDMGKIEVDRGVKMIEVRFDGEKLSFLAFEYGRCELTILDIRSSVPRMGYATMLLGALLDIVKIHNSAIEDSVMLTRKVKDIYIIKSIKGNIVPVEGIINSMDLYNFYDRLGFIQDERLLRLV